MKMPALDEKERVAIRPRLLASIAGGRYVFPLVSLLLLAPCYWLPRLQATDLSSHIYNSWLAQLIESGHANGLAVVNPKTNVLFDLVLSSLFRWFGADIAQRVSVSLAVLVFMWGAFAFIRSVAGRKPWELLPCIAMMAYGWVFHMGFFNYYLSLALCLWALSVAWKMTPGRVALSIPVFLLAGYAHALPVFWTGGLLLYAAAACRLAPRYRVLLTLNVILALGAIHYLIAKAMPVQWSPAQIIFTMGLDQVWVFDAKYYIVLIGLMMVWGLMFLNLVHNTSLRRVAGSLPFQLCLISASAVAILPDVILILSFIAARMSLAVGVCVCALLAGARPGRLPLWGMAAVAALFFGFLYVDERALNSLESRMETAVSHLPPGQRVVSAIADPDSRFNSVVHMIDRVCVHRCFSYGNYEASTAQFRVRAEGPNPFVTASYSDSCEIQLGQYVVKASEAPIYEIDIDPRGRLFIQSLDAGMHTSKTRMHILQLRLPDSPAARPGKP